MRDGEKGNELGSWALVALARGRVSMFQVSCFLIDSTALDDLSGEYV